ncbi:AAA family ATPase, partial [Isoptericola sp. NPDC060282]|uniref:AAA family ATPase n=1 Tax=Isoptericola sp. NPDC060282 TaxID=3347093 RepID=UPI0036515193
MRVSRIEFMGYRRLADTATAIDGPITAFVGFNEAGKTSLLSALEWFSIGGELPPTDENRSRPPASDNASVVKVFFEFEDGDKKAFSSVPMDNPPTSLVLYKKRDGRQIYDLRPNPRRPARPFVVAAERLSTAKAKLASQFTSASDAVERDAVDWAETISEMLAKPDDAWSEERVEDLIALSKWLQETPAGRKGARDAKLGRMLDEVHSLVVQEHPTDAVWSAVESRVPSFVLFRDEDRDLQTSYLIQPDKREIPPAVTRLLSIAGLDLDCMWDYIQQQDTTKRETALERANGRLLDVFDAAWNQSKVAVRLNVNSQRLEVLIKELHGNGDVTKMSERSDGLKTFVSLVAFLESGGHAVPLFANEWLDNVPAEVAEVAPDGAVRL